MASVRTNVVRLHKTLRVTPAMAANVTDRIWSLEELVDPRHLTLLLRVVTAIAEKPTDGTYPCIVVTMWYEPPEPN
jgi:hypothetical protein